MPWKRGLYQQLAEIREKLTTKCAIKLIPPFRCDFRDSWGNRIQVVDLHHESLVLLLPYQEVQKAGVKLSDLDKETSRKRLQLQRAGRKCGWENPYRHELRH